MGHLGFGYNFEMIKRRDTVLNIYPFADVDYIYLMQDGYKEHGAKGINLKVSDKEYDLLRPEVGLGLGYAGCFQRGVFVNLDLAASYIREQRFLGKDTHARFEHSSCKFTVKGLKPDNNLFSPTVRITAGSLDKTSISASLEYHGEFGEHFSKNAVEGEINVAF